MMFKSAAFCALAGAQFAPTEVQSVRIGGQSGILGKRKNNQASQPSGQKIQKTQEENPKVPQKGSSSSGSEGSSESSPDGANSNETDELAAARGAVQDELKNFLLENNNWVDLT
jgi:hypothetical protein